MLSPNPPPEAVPPAPLLATFASCSGVVPAAAPAPAKAGAAGNAIGAGDATVGLGVCVAATAGAGTDDALSDAGPGSPGIRGRPSGGEADGGTAAGAGAGVADKARVPPPPLPAYGATRGDVGTAETAEATT